MNRIQVNFVKCHESAIIPTRSHDNDCGYDLYSVEYIEILPLQRGLISTGIKLEMPDYAKGKISSRSGLSAKYGLEVGAGVIDASYRGELKVVLHNFNFDLKQLAEILHPSAFTSLFGQTGKYIVKPGDKIAQIIFGPYFSVDFVEVNQLSDTTRSEGGFGSSGH